MHLNTHIRNTILFALAYSALLTTSCSNPYEDIPEPDYPPQMVHLSPPLKTNGKRIPSHLITAPDTFQSREIYIGPAELKYTTEKTGYQLAGEPEFTPSQAKGLQIGGRFVARPVVLR